MRCAEIERTGARYSVRRTVSQASEKQSTLTNIGWPTERSIRERLFRT